MQRGGAAQIFKNMYTNYSKNTKEHFLFLEKLMVCKLKNNYIFLFFVGAYQRGK